MNDVFVLFTEAQPSDSDSDFRAVSLAGSDYLARSRNGGPVFLLSVDDASAYTPAIELRHVRIDFGVRCRVSSDGADRVGTFALVSCDSGTPELHEVFVRSVYGLMSPLGGRRTTSELKASLERLLTLFASFSRPSNREFIGLWGELFIIATCASPSAAIAKWRNESSEKFDFSWGAGCVEVKATTLETRVHDFSLDQLRPVGRDGYVASLLLRSAAGGVGLLELGRRIDAAIGTDVVLRQKLWNNIAQSLGNDFSERLDKSYDPLYAARHLRLFSMAAIPACEAPADSRVSQIKFRSDLTGLNAQINSRALLESLLSM